MKVSIAGGDTAQHRCLRKRVALVARLAGPLAGRCVLDCGCGAGAYARAYASLGARALGVEYDRGKLRRAAAAAAPEGAGRVALVAGDLERLPLRAASADVAVLNEVLEHVPDDSRALAEIQRVLKPDGVLIVLSPNRVYPFESHGVAWRPSGRALPVYTPFVPYLPLRLGSRVLEYWARNYWPWQLRGLVRAAGFEIFESGFVAQTFENVSRAQGGSLRRAAPLLRALAGAAERVPGLRALCSVSQLVAARPRHRTGRA